MLQFLAFACLLATALAGPGNRKPNPDSVTRDVGSFTGISILEGNNVQVVAILGDEESVTIEGTPEVQEAFSTVVDAEGVLQITITRLIRQPGDHRIVVRAKQLTRLSTAGSSEIIIQTPFTVDRLELTTKSSSQIILQGAVTADVFTATAKGSSRIIALLRKSGQVEVSADKTASVTLTGTAAALSLNIVNDGSFRGGLVVDKINAKVTGRGKATLTARKTINVDKTSTAEVVTGGPAKVTIIIITQE